MDKENLKSYIEVFLRDRNFPLNKPFRCLNPVHRDTHPSMRYDPKRYAVHCFSCGADYDLFSLMEIESPGISFAEQVALAEQLFTSAGRPKQTEKARKQKVEKGIPIEQQGEKQNEQIKEYLALCAKRVTQTTYFSQRGLSQTIVKRFGLGFDPCYTKGTGRKEWKAAILPTAQNCYTARNTDPEAPGRERVRKTGESAFLGFSSLEGEEAVFVVEGEFDALSLYEIGSCAVSLGSCANVSRFLRDVEKRFEKHKKLPPLLLALDADEAGEKAQAQLLAGLLQIGCGAYAVDILGGTKDPNEALCKDRQAFCEAVHAAQALQEREREEEKKAYLSNSSAAHIGAFLGQIDGSINTPAISTGFSQLDVQLDGGLYEGLYILGAISSLGKTSLMLQIADQIAEKGQDVLLFSLEMARSELMAKSISRHTLIDCLGHGKTSALAKTARGITVGSRYASYSLEEHQVITRAIEYYSLYAQRLFIHEGIGDIGAAQIRSMIQKHMDITGHVPVVIIDYLQILSPHSERATDKQNTDRAVLELKRMSRDFKLSVLGISSFNRANYSQRVSMEAFKESGAIEYSSDVLFGLQLAGAGEDGFDVNAAKRENPRQIELVILKNRNGQTGGIVPFKYYPMFNCFAEEE